MSTGIGTRTRATIQATSGLSHYQCVTHPESEVQGVLGVCDVFHSTLVQRDFVCGWFRSQVQVPAVSQPLAARGIKWEPGCSQVQSSGSSECAESMSASNNVHGEQGGGWFEADLQGFSVVRKTAEQT